MKMTRTQSGILEAGTENVVEPVKVVLKTIPFFQNNWTVLKIAENKVSARTDLNSHIPFSDWCENYLKQLSEYSDSIGAAFDAKLVNGWQVEVIFEIM